MVTKEKNLIKIIDKRDKEWVYDINLGKWIQGDANENVYIKFAMYTDRRTDNVCRYIALTLCTAVACLPNNMMEYETKPRWWNGDHNADFIRYIDKCVSANVPCLPQIRDYAPDFKTIMAHLGEYAELVANNSKVSQYYRACPDLPQYYMTSNPLPEYEMEDRMESIVDTWSHNRYVLDVIRKYAPHYEKLFIDLTCQDKNDICYLCMREVVKNNPRYVEISLYYFFKLLPYYHIAGDCVISPIIEYIKRCDFLKISPRKESNFIKLLVDVDKEYQVKKREFDKKLLVERYAPHLENLAFENDKYIIVIPQTEEEFIEEARMQRNCVYSCYYPKLVEEQDESMRIVFMRRKGDVNTPYVTIELDLRNSGWHRIQQALQRNNECIENQEANQFIEEYEKHLQTCYPTTRDDDENEVAWEF